jgi:DNA-binding XRE family transcriptional regulator
MSRRAASITQAEIARAVRAAKQTGAAEVEVRIGAASMFIRISPSTALETALEKVEQIIL